MAKYKEIADIIYEGADRWWTISQIAAEQSNMEYDDFLKLPIGAREIICSHVKTFIPHVYSYFDEEIEALLLSEKFDGERMYKRATIGDEAYVNKKIRKENQTKTRILNRLRLRFDNAKKQGLLPDRKKHKELVESLE